MERDRDGKRIERRGRKSGKAEGNGWNGIWWFSSLVVPLWGGLTPLTNSEASTSGGPRTDGYLHTERERARSLSGWN